MAEGQKYSYSADLDTRAFLAGLRSIDTGLGQLRTSVRGFEADVRRASGTAGANAEHIGSSWTSAGSKIQGALSGAIGMLTRFAALAGAAVGIVTGLASKFAILDSAKFESTVARAAILSQATPEQHRAMLRDAMQGGTETPFGVQGFAESMQVEAQRGRTPDEIIALTNATKKFAVVANIDMAQAAETLSQVMFQFGLPMQEAEKTALRLANATTATALSGHEMFDALKFAGGAAGVFGGDLTELLAVLGTLRRTMDASTASTALKNMMMVSSSLDAKNPKQLEKLGITEEEAHSFDFMTGKAKGLLQVMRGIADAVKEHPALQEKIFGTRTTLAFLAALKQTDEFYATLKDRINDVSLAQEQYTQILGLADNTWNRLGKTAEAVMVSIGIKIREALSLDTGADSVGQYLSQLAQDIQSIPKKNVQEVIDTLGAGMIDAFGTALAFLVKSIPPIGMLFGEVLLKGVTNAIEKLGASDYLDPYAAEHRSYKEQYRAMSDEARHNEDVRLALMFGLDPKRATTSRLGFSDYFLSPVSRVNQLRAQSMAEVLEEHGAQNAGLRSTMDAIQANLADASAELQHNPSIVAARNAIDAGRASRAREEYMSRFRPGDRGTNYGIINNYGVPSSGARAAPSRPSGVSAPEAASR